MEIVELTKNAKEAPEARETPYFRYVMNALKGSGGGTVLALFLIVITWHFSTFFVPDYIFPKISTVAAKFVEIVKTDSTYTSLLDTLQRILGGFAISAVVGISVGVAMSLNRTADAILMPVVKIIMSVPALTWVLLSIIWFRSTELRVWFIMFILVFPIVAINTYDGVRSISPELMQMVRSLRPTRAGMLRMLVIPSAMPFIFSGLKISLSFGGRIAVFAEALSASSGIGAKMYMMNQLFDTPGIIVWTILLIGVLSLFDFVLTVIERRWFRWREDVHR